MNSSILRKLVLFCWLAPAITFGQTPAMKLKLKLISQNTWGVFVKPEADINTGQTITVGGDQVTVVMPKNYAFNNVTQVNGIWSANAFVHGPAENPTKSYISFGLQSETQPIPYQNGVETLLFTFKGDGTCPDSLYLIDNASDPFTVHPNSVNSNPENEFSVFDMINFNSFSYGGNYSPSSWNCHDNDGDGIANGIEDTNGNGIFDTGDASDLNIYNDGISLSLKLIEPNKWGVYVKTDINLHTGQTITIGGSQATVVMPKNYGWHNLVSINGTWQTNYPFHGPDENPTKSYIFFNLQSETQPIPYQNGVETLLFTFEGDGTCPDSMYLIDNATDPFNVLPNYWNSNPGNEFDVFDIISFNLFSYSGNYSTSGWDCHDNDGDGILNAFEDTNGNGIYDPGMDNSDLNNSCNNNLTLGNIPNVIACDTTVAYFVVAFNQPQPEITYGWWQVADAENGPWEHITNSAGIYIGRTFTNMSANGHDTLYIFNAPDSLNGKWYRAEFTTPICSAPIYSNAAQLTLGGQISIAQQPLDFTNCANKEALFYSKVFHIGQGEVFSQWQMSADGGITWSDISQYANIINGDTINFGGYSNSDSLLISPLTGMDGYQFRTIFWTSACNRDTTSAATLHVEGAITFTDQPDDLTFCSSGNASFTVAVNNTTGVGNLQFQWQRFQAGAWVDLTNTSPYSGTWTNQLSISNATNLNTSKYRCKVKTGNCGWVYSNLANLIVLGPVIFTEQPTSTVKCTTESATMTAMVFVPNSGTPSYRWQSSTDGINFTDITSPGTNGFSGMDTPVLSISSVAGLNSQQFRMAASVGQCPNMFYSNPATLTVQDCPNGCIRLKLQFLPDSSGWAVMAKPFGGYVPTATAMTTAGRVTLVAPSDFILDGFLTPSGNWSPTQLTQNVPGHPGKKYFTFELSPGAQGTHIPFDFDEAVTLFQFDKTGTCPDSLYLLETAIPGVQPNMLVGQDAFLQLPIDFEYCGIYARKNWRCNGSNSPGGPIILVTEDEFTGGPQTGTDKLNSNFPEGKKPKLQASQTFTLAPNPASDFVSILVSADLADGQNTLTLWDLQGKKHLEISLENTTAQLDLSSLAAGVYLVSLAQNGQVVERKKLVKQ
ncbi:MAG: T9SS type A sorting domain-containing protein [Bacteroidetes bacterium]|nr:T9SS type A sorting domain-containing protein [Bacteroidota bacterium]